MVVMSVGQHHRTLDKDTVMDQLTITVKVEVIIVANGSALYRVVGGYRSITAIVIVVGES